MEGGATGGYCEIGSCVIATLPSTMMNSAITHAKMGRSMKNLAMEEGSLVLSCGRSGSAAGGRGRRGGRCRGRRRTRLPRHRLHRARAAQLLEAVDHHLLAGLQAVGDEPLA